MVESGSFSEKRNKRSYSLENMLVSGTVKTNSTVALSQEILKLKKKSQNLCLQLVGLLFTKNKLHYRNPVLLFLDISRNFQNFFKKFA